MTAQAFRLENWVDELQQKGQNAFTLQQARAVFHHISEAALSLALARYSGKQKIVSILRGYYLIIAPKYAAMKVIPPENFIDGLMKSLGRPYYVGLLSAAAMQGASHQQPQEFFVFTGLPAMRPIQKNGIKVNFISLVHFPNIEFFERIKTEVGYISISPPVLTALDLVCFEQKVGGLSRCATVLIELLEDVRPTHFNASILSLARISTLQRLGYILENEINRLDLSTALYKYCQKVGLNFNRIKLDPTSSDKGCAVNKKWNVVLNTTIELDL